MNTLYVGDVGTKLIIDIGISADDVTEAKIIVKKPNGSIVEWNALPISGTQTVEYIIQNGDLDLAGKYTIQVYIDTGSWQGHGTPDTFFVNPII